MTTPVTRAPSQPNLLPPSVRKQAEAADKLVAGLKNRPAAAPSTEAQPPAAAVATPPVEAQPPAGPSEASAAAAATGPDAEERARKAEQRFNSLKGKYDQEVGATREINRQQAELITQLMAERATPAPAAAATATPKSPEEVLKSLGATDKDIEDYGELLPIVARMAENMFKPTLAKLEAEITQLRASAGTVSKELVKTRQADVFGALDRAVPNWRAINEDPDFLDWLSHIDIFSGTSRRVALTSAFNALDAERVSGIFRAYVQDDPRRAAASGNPAVDAETLLAPGTPRSGPSGAPEGAGGKKIWSEQEIGHFYTRVRKKQVSPEEYANTAKEIALAVSEGRVKPASKVRHINDR